MTLASSKTIDSSKFYYSEKSENLQSCLLYVCSIMAKNITPNVNNGLDTSQKKAVNL